MPVEIVDRGLVDHEDEAHEQPVPSQHRRVDVTVRETQMRPHLLGDAVQVTVEERFVGPRVRRPELDAGAVAAHVPDLREDVVRLVDVLEEVRREHLVDGVVRERKGIGGEVEDVIDLFTGEHVETRRSRAAWRCRTRDRDATERCRRRCPLPSGARYQRPGGRYRARSMIPEMPSRERSIPPTSGGSGTRSLISCSLVIRKPAASTA